MQFEYMDELAALFFLGVPITIGLLICLVALGIAWGGRRVGMLFGMAGGLVGLTGLLLTSPQLWWVAIVPLGFGAAAVRTWYKHDGPVTARRLRFDLRGMFVLILLLTLMLAGAMSEYHQTRIEKEVVAKLEALSDVSVSWRFDRVHQVVWFSPLTLDDFDRAADGLQQLSQLHSLQIAAENLPGTIIKRVGRLTTLRNLYLQTLTVTDNDLRPLANLANLEYLELDASQLTDAGLLHLRGLKRLRALYLYGDDQITPAARARLRAGLPRLDHP